METDSPVPPDLVTARRLRGRPETVQRVGVCTCVNTQTRTHMAQRATSHPEKTRGNSASRSLPVPWAGLDPAEGGGIGTASWVASAVLLWPLGSPRPALLPNQTLTPWQKMLSRPAQPRGVVSTVPQSPGGGHPGSVCFGNGADLPASSSPLTSSSVIKALRSPAGDTGSSRLGQLSPDLL